jgi:hypothetical protein
MTYDGSSTANGVSIYVDGDPVSLTIKTDSLTDTIDTSAPAEIGARNNGYSTHFNGSMASAGVYGKELSETEVSNLHTEGAI